MSANTRNAMDALNEARAAWARTQPQYVIPGVLDDGPVTPLVHAAAPPAAAGTGTIVEPAPTPKPDLPRGGLTAGAEPGCDTGLTANQPVAAAHPHSSPRVGLGALTPHNGPGRRSREDMRGQGQEGA